MSGVRAVDAVDPVVEDQDLLGVVVTGFVGVVDDDGLAVALFVVGVAVVRQRQDLPRILEVGLDLRHGSNLYRGRHGWPFDLPGHGTHRVPADDAAVLRAVQVGASFSYAGRLPLLRRHPHRAAVFIARAKGFGFSLDEITGLLGDDECAPVQDRLSDLVDAKIADAQAKVTELEAFTAELRRVAAALSNHTPVGPCDDEWCPNSASAGSCRSSLAGWLRHGLAVGRNTFDSSFS